MCITPITINKGKPDEMKVGCGSCAPCFLKYTNQWAFRVAIHANSCVQHYCVTLTYNNENLPMSQSKTGDTIYSWMTLSRAHASGFFKNLRNNHIKKYGKNAPKISYIICGEYGDKFKRPHYHAIIFNCDYDTILSSWDKGDIHFGDNNVDASIRYALKYVMKSRLWKLESNKAYERPFVNFSKGIGESLIVLSKKRYCVVNPDGEFFYRTIRCVSTSELPENLAIGKYKLMLPRYYADKLHQNVDTEPLRLAAVEKNLTNEKLIADNGLTPIQWRKQYKKWLFSLKRDDMWDNLLLSDKNLSIISKM